MTCENPPFFIRVFHDFGKKLQLRVVKSGVGGHNICINNHKQAIAVFVSVGILFAVGRRIKIEKHGFITHFVVAVDGGKSGSPQDIAYAFKKLIPIIFNRTLQRSPVDRINSIRVSEKALFKVNAKFKYSSSDKA